MDLNVLGVAICSNWTSGDLSDITSKGLRVIHFDKDYTHATDLPFNYGDLLHIGSFFGTSNFNIQLAFSNGTGSNMQIKVRRRWGDTFGAWKDLLT